VKVKKEVTIYDIADKLGVSAAAVSRALKNNPSTSFSTIKKMNARNLFNKRVDAVVARYLLILKTCHTFSNFKTRIYRLFF